MSFTAMYINKEIEDLTPYRYLDSLDSVRFRDVDALLNGTQLHAYADFLLALLMGEGIVVANNQLMDSLAFIDVSAQLIQAAKKTNKIQYLSLRASLFGSTNPYEIAANNFGKIGTDKKNHEDRFVLSGWPYLDTDYSRRTKWAQKLAFNQGIPTEPEFVLPDEVLFVEKLNIVLEYFNSPDGQKNIRSAQPNKSVRINEIHQVADLSKRETEELLSDLNGKDAQILLDAISILNKLKNNITDIDIRSNIINALTLPQSNKLNPIYFEKTTYPNDAHKAVLSIVDSIYNYSAGFGVGADLIGHTAKANAQDTKTPSFYGLAAWARLTNKSERKFILSAPNGIVVPSGIQWNRLIQKKKTMEYLLKEKFPWGILLEATTEPAWRTSLHIYLKSLQEFRNSEGLKISEAEKKYSYERLRHLDQSKHRIPNTYIDITNNEFRIRAKEFDELEMEISTSEERGTDNESNQRNENSSTTGVTGTVGGKIGLSTELSGEVSGSLETTVSINNEKYTKQSSLLQNMTSVKGKPSLVLRIGELKDFYQEQETTKNAIKGIIAAIKEGIA